MFKLFRRADGASPADWHVTYSAAGVHLHPTASPGSQALTAPMLSGWFRQLEDEGFTTQHDGTYVLAWESVYALLVHTEHAPAAQMLELPPIGDVRAVLRSKGSLEDSDFSIAIEGWERNGRAMQDASLVGALLRQGKETMLLPAQSWTLLTQVRTFARREPQERNGQQHRLAWGQIRAQAKSADAKLDSFLHKSVVLTPEKLNIGIRKSALADDMVIEVQPTFDGAPEDWLAWLDRHSKVQSRYDIPTAEGVVQVVISSKVRTVLEEVKRMPQRRVAGARAQAFITNPYAALGQDANDVIDEEQFAQARTDAGLLYERFIPQFERDVMGYPLRVGLLVETADTQGPVSSENLWLDDTQLAKFVKALKAALDGGFLLLAWQGFDLELQGEAPQYLKELEQALQERSKPPVLITYAQVYDLSHYASRVQEIGFEQPYYSPYILKKDDKEPWFPKNVVPVITFTPEGGGSAVSVAVTDANIAELAQRAAVAKAAGQSTFEFPGLDRAITVDEAEAIGEAFHKGRSAVADGTFIPQGEPDGAADTGRREPLKGPGTAAPRKSPVLWSNIQCLDYVESGPQARADALDSTGVRAELPTSLGKYKLEPHQEAGVAWLQTLFKASSRHNCRGALLADDMGLGKTFQLLTLMAWAIEQDPNIAPMLVVAPVSLLENWKEESVKFFKEGALPILTAYGDELAKLRVPRENIDPRLLAEDGLSRFLRPGWLGNARVVLTTYETLRDLEFSFAMQRWSLMVCDEAQKIKNPAAMVTRAAKKQNVGFKIACTGTPVENSLADLWCLFDFAQPGLLGALSDFGNNYRRPIEAETEEEKARVEELTELVAPQILRRTKAQVANLPPKIVDAACRSLALSSEQRKLYANAIDQFNKRKEAGASSPFKNHLGLLHYLRLICTDPRRYGLNGAKPEPLAQYRSWAPKLDWLLGQLGVIQAQGEKVIIFCEFRNIQRLLQHYIEETFGIRPDIINGDTSASAANVNSRQKRIRAFQELPGFGVIVLSPVAVGFGVNIQAANHVVHYTRTWNPAKEDQATDRAYRIGQKKPVYVYYPVVAAPDFFTFDVLLDQLLDSKRKLATNMLNGSGDMKPGDFALTGATPPEAAIVNEKVNDHVVLSMTWEYFEALATVLYAKRGYRAQRTPGSRDNGVDVVALPVNHSKGKLVQAKSSSVDDAHLGWSAVKDVVGGHAHYARLYPRVEFELECITNQYFDTQSHANAKLNGVELVEQPQLLEMLARTPVTMQEVERVLYCEWSDV